MYVFGAIDFASAVARIGKFMGYRVTVCDARAVFATRERFPSADEVVVAWPDEFLKTAEVDKRTVICVLTHDPKFDVPVLTAALATEAGYIGAMGSRRTHDNRTARLKEEGATDEDLSRISSPIGLDIGARTPEETAVAIAGEIIALRTGHSGGRLAERSGAIHAPQQEGDRANRALSEASDFASLLYCRLYRMLSGGDPTTHGLLGKGGRRCKYRRGSITRWRPLSRRP